MNKLKILAEIFGKSFLLLVLAVEAIGIAVYTQILFREQGITVESVSLLMVAIVLFTLITLPSLPTSYHNLVCKPAEKVENANTEK